MQTSFNSGEWSPALNARVDIQKYHSGAALLRNFFVDYRGGATTRPGTRFIQQAKSNSVRLIPFQASFAVTYMLEFGPGYIRFFNNGAPVLEAATSITVATPGVPYQFTDTAHGYATGDWIVAGGSTYVVFVVNANTFTLQDTFGNGINFNPFTLPAPSQRVYTIASPYLNANDLPLIKYAQDVNMMFLCHPNYLPQVLTLNSAVSWTLAAINFQPTLSAPTGVSVAVAGTAGALTASYTVTAVDGNGQESLPAIPAQAGTCSNTTTQTVSWTAVIGAVAYNVYRTILSATATIPTGVPYGFIGSVTSTKIIDTNIAPDFSQTQPVANNPFAGSGVATVALTSNGTNYHSVPTVSFTAAPGGGITAQGYAILGTQSVSLSSSTYYWPYPGYQGANINMGYGVVVQIGLTFYPPAGTPNGWYVSNVGLISAGAFTGGGTAPSSLTFTTTGASGASCSFTINVVWNVVSVSMINPGAGYASAPAVTFTGGGFSTPATATTTLGAASLGNPLVPMMVQQRLFLGGQTQSPAAFNLSQPGAPFNFNIAFPLAADDAISGTLTSSSLHTIKAALPVSAGQLIFTDKASWLMNGGAPGAPLSATQLSANPQGYAGCGDVMPIAMPLDIIYVQAKNSVVRDLSYNFYLNNYVGADISILSQHLFYGFSIRPNWMWAEEPFKLVWAVRNDGILLCLTMVKEQELIAWTHHDTQGLFVSTGVINETTLIGNVDAAYFAVNRTVQGQAVTYIERMAELYYPADYVSAWQVDAGIGYNGPAATTFSGAQHLAGMIVTGIADGAIINFTMPTSGTFVFGPGGTTGLTNIPSASIVTVGLAFTPQLQTLALDTGEPTVQGKRKKITGVTVRCRNTLGLSIGQTFNSLVPMKDLVIGNIGTMSNAPVVGLVTGDARTIIDPNWTVPGQYCIQQSNPYPASILGVIPEITLGDANSK
jgi:hypothetical protein